jgi:hypothetical protein
MRMCWILVFALCAGCFGGSSPEGHDHHLGVVAMVPRTWSVTWRPCPDCADPRGIFVASSFATREGPRGLMCGPLPAGGVVVSLDEVLARPLGGRAPRRRDFAPRPASFRIGALRSAAVFEGCNQARTRLFRFRDAGRLLYAWAVFGPHASRAIRARAEALLDGLRISPTG